MQRLRALEQLDKISNDKAYSFSVTFSCTDAMRQAIQRKLLGFIGETEKLVADAKEEEVYQLNIDLFDWS